MRAMILVLALAAAAPAAAQTPYTDQLRLNELQTQADLARQRAISQDNQLTALDAQIRADQAIRDIQLQRALPPLLPRADPNAPPPTLDVSQLPSIPDSALAASNQAVREASRPRR
jgi:hypothetical protein